MPYRSIKTKYIELPSLDDGEANMEGIPNRKYSIVHDKGVYRLTALNVRIRQEQGYTTETTVIFNNNYKAAKIAEGRYSQSKADQYANNIDQLVITLLGE